jgi:hypothetical protein
MDRNVIEPTAMPVVADQNRCDDPPFRDTDENVGTFSTEREIEILARIVVRHRQLRACPQANDGVSICCRRR